MRLTHNRFGSIPPQDHEHAYMAVMLHVLPSLFLPKHVESVPRSFDRRSAELVKEFHDVRDCLRLVRSLNAKQSLDSPNKWACVFWRNGENPKMGTAGPHGIVRFKYCVVPTYPADGWKPASLLAEPPIEWTTTQPELTEYKTAHAAVRLAILGNRKYLKPTGLDVGHPLRSVEDWSIVIAVESIARFSPFNVTRGIATDIRSRRVHVVDERWPLSVKTLAMLGR